MRLIFMGTPAFAVPTLASLIDAGHDIAAVYAQPPRPAGRGLSSQISPVLQFASKRKLNIETPPSLKTEEARAVFEGFNADATVVAAYGLLLPRTVLDSTRLGAFNVHASLLPRWRGAAPSQRAIMAGDAKTGVTIMRMEEGLDEGQICHTGDTPITPRTIFSELHDELAEMGAQLMREALVLLDTGLLNCASQPSSGITYATKIAKSETHIDFTRDAEEVRNRIHGLSLAPGAWFATEQSGRQIRVKALLAEVVEGNGKPGEVLDDRLCVACGRNAIQLLKVQREGKSPMNAETFLRGTEIPRGALLA